jgi:imidazolonepropionase-like amidohydrolase
MHRELIIQRCEQFAAASSEGIFPNNGSRLGGLLRIVCLLAGGWLSSPAWGQTGTSPDEGIRFSPPNSVLLTDATVTVAPGKTLENASILISEGRIREVGDIEPPAGVEVIRMKGKHLYPAMVDPHAEFEAKTFEPTAGHWNSNVMPQRRMDSLANLEASKLEAYRKAGFAVVLVAPNDGLIKGQSCVVLTSPAPLEQALLKPTAFQHIQLYPARRSRTYPNSPMGAVALLRQTFSDADWYERARQTAEAFPATPAPETNVALEHLLPIIRGKQTLIADGANEQYALRSDRLAREFSAKLIVRGSGREYRRLDAIKAADRTFIIPVNFPDAPSVGTRDDVANATLQELMHWRLAPENPARLEQAGIKFVLTADRLSKVGELLPNVRKAIERGLSEETALRALTIGPAELLEVDRLVGSLEKGKLGNLIVASGPLFDKDTKIEETWVAGKRYAWENQQETDLRGEWQLTLADTSDGSLTIKLEGKPEKLSGKIGLPAAFAKTEASSNQAEQQDPPESKSNTDEATSGTTAANDAVDEEGEKQGSAETKEKAKPKTIELKNVAFNGYRLMASFDARELSDKPGTAWLSAVMFNDEASETDKLLGTVRWADDSEQFVTIERQASRQDDGKDQPVRDKQGEKGRSDADPLVACEVNYPLGAFGLAEQPDQPEWLLVRGATLWTCGEQGILENADMLIHRGIIVDVGHGIEAPEGAITIDASGMHVSPGIIDCHSHMATDGGVNESGQAITAEVRIADFIDPNDITIYRQLAGGVTAANILHGSANPIGGQNQVIKLRWGMLDEEMKMKEAPEGIKFALGENVKQSSRTESTRYPQSRMGVEQIISDRFEAALKYRDDWRKWSTRRAGLPPRRDYELDAIVEILEHKRWVHCHSYRQDEILTMLRTLERYGVTIGSLQHILEGYKVADAMARHGATGSSFSDWWAYKFEVYDAIPHNGALMHKAGIVVSFNSDDSELARHLNHEAAKAVKYGGVEPIEALKFVTLNPAKQLRIDTWVGSLEVGKQADFVVWNRSPLSTLSMCTQTWIDGRKYFDRDLDAQMRKQHAALHQSLVQSILKTGAKTRTERPDDDPSFWWVRFDEFCHDHHGHDDEIHHHHDHHHDHYEE